MHQGGKPLIVFGIRPMCFGLGESLSAGFFPMVGCYKVLNLGLRPRFPFGVPYQKEKQRRQLYKTHTQLLILSRPHG